MSKDFILNVQNSNVLRVTAFGIEHINSAPCLILVHGFKGFKDWGFGPYIGDYFSKKGFFVLTFNFSHNGVGDSLTEFVELDKFAENTFSLEMDELKELTLAYDFGFFGNSSNKGIGLIGHSRGGAISLLVGSESDDVKAVCAWSTVSNFDRYTNRQKDEWKKNGYIEIMNTRTKQRMKLNVSLLEDIENNKEGSLNIEQAVKNLNKPMLIVQGKNDLAVPVKEAEKLYDWSNKELTELLIIPAAGHTFDMKHPFEGSNKKFDTILKKTNNFFKTNLK
ncbi:MAG: acyl-CoA thioester hydrolase/BAAT C-terminal domain-containing protein [Ignavibacteriaceae bacterium]